eukprot:gene34225-41428_t
MALQMRTFNIFALTLVDVLKIARVLIPPLEHTHHKGSMGRVGVFGGSRDYTGAPYYAASSALKFGADLSFVFCSEKASIPIKSYSPELMTTPIYRESFLEGYNDDPKAMQHEVARAAALADEFMPRLHSLVVGPGMGRQSDALAIAEAFVDRARRSDRHLVIDADGLFMLCKNPLLVMNCQNCFLTPNAVEFDRLVDAVLHLPQHTADSPLRAELMSPDLYVRIRALSIALGHVGILRKGAEDVVTLGGDVFVLRVAGQKRRCGGQGDILAGCLATSLHWAAGLAVSLDRQSLELLRSEHSALAGTPADRDSMVMAAMLATTVVKKASVGAFEKHRRSMTAPDVLQELGAAFAEIEDASVAL